MSGLPSQSTQPPLPPFSFPSLSSNPFFTPSRKRRAPSPTSIFSPTSPQSSSSWIDDPHSEKRRRPNLANGFSSLSLSSRTDDRHTSPLPTYEDSQAAHREVDDDEVLAQPHIDLVGDVRVEELPTRPTGSRSFPSRGDSTSSTSTSSAEDGYDSDITFRVLGSGRHRHAGVAQQADMVEQPNIDGFLETTDLGVEDVTERTPTRGRKRREENAETRGGWKRRKPDKDVDMVMGDANDARETERRHRRTEWHEPEKDRIVITSLGSPSSSRSSSSDRSTGHLTQPGSHGFTLSPSFLTHLLAAQKEQFGGAWCGPKQEQGLVLWRPLGLPLGWNDQVVRPWEGVPGLREDEARFQEVDQDEPITATPEGEMMEVEEDMAMEVE